MESYKVLHMVAEQKQLISVMQDKGNSSFSVKKF